MAKNLFVQRHVRTHLYLFVAKSALIDFINLVDVQEVLEDPWLSLS
jgi:hypothetical protein